MSCIVEDLSTYAESTDAEDDSKLCEVCQKIPWFDLTERKTYRFDHDHSHFLIGSLEQCSKKQFCPGCRLIFSVAASTCSESDETYKSQISLDSRHIYGKHKSDENHDCNKRIRCHIDVGFWQSSTILGAVCRKSKPDIAPLIDLATSASLFEEEDAWGCGRDLHKEANIGLIKDWLRFCRANHPECHFPVYDTVGDIKFRLIDTLDQRIIWSTPKQDYATLSYVWGATKGLLTRDTVLTYFSLNGLRSCNIPKTISDAMELVAQLGMRYLWVDSLCIIQDDDGDKRCQLPLMGYIYNQATLGIMAAGSTDAHDGLSRLRSVEQSLPQRTEIITGTPLITVQPELQDALLDSRWNTRGWTFQETVLSRRAIIFTKGQMYWNCLNESWREDRIEESSVLKRPLDCENSFLSPLVVNRPKNYCMCNCRNSIYCEQVEFFSKRRFGLSSDVVWGFMGIMKTLASRFPQGFIWGIPYEGIDIALLWSDICTCPHTHPRHATHTMHQKDGLYDVSYPSWSWLSSETEVSWQWLAPAKGVPDTARCGHFVLSAVTWHKPFRLGDEVSSELLNSIYPTRNYSDGMERASLWSQELSTFGMKAFDYGILHFTAQTAELTLRPSSNDEKSKVNCVEGCIWRVPLRRAVIHAHDGDAIGEMMVPSKFLGDNRDGSYTFVLLSSNTEQASDESCKLLMDDHHDKAIEHVHGCSHVVSRNIMLIEWDGMIAYRRGLTTVSKDDWDRVKTTEKTILLG